ncbi:MAG: AsnC family transcriptional regulator, partial [Jatrophihabitantaceae bacterium]
MTADSSNKRSGRAVSPNRLRSRQRVVEPLADSLPGQIDAIDRVLLQALAADARITNNALAELAGIAASTCLGRVRALRERG